MIPNVEANTTYNFFNLVDSMNDVIDATNSFDTAKAEVSTMESYLANTNAQIKTKMSVANTNAALNLKLNTSTYNSTLANTNAQIATKVSTTTYTAGLATKMAVSNTITLVNTKMSVANTVTLVNTKMSVANTVALAATKMSVSNTNTLLATKVSASTFNSALANTNNYIATKVNTSTYTDGLATKMSVANTNTLLNAKVPTGRTISTSGLASGGGDLSTNRTITVTVASQSQAQAGTDNTVAMTPLRTKNAIDTFAQAKSTTLTTISGLAVTNGNFIVGNGSTWITEQPSTVRSRLGLGTMALVNSPVPIANGGTASTSVAGARANLGLSLPIGLNSGGTGASDGVNGIRNLLNQLSTTDGAILFKSSSGWGALGPP